MDYEHEIARGPAQVQLYLCRLLYETTTAQCLV
jgi:hypothetical protein